jgi:molybdopterin-guanine dinucleotide biosynthesis protein A
VIGLWPVGLADDLAARLAAGVRAVRRFADVHDPVTVDFPLIEFADRSIDPFFNANTPEDLDEARRLLALNPP